MIKDNQMRYPRIREFSTWKQLVKLHGKRIPITVYEKLNDDCDSNLFIGWNKKLDCPISFKVETIHNSRYLIYTINH